MTKSSGKGPGSFGCLIELAVVALLVMAWRLNSILGIVLTCLYVMAGPGMLSVFFAELFEPREPSPPAKRGSSPLVHLVGSQAKTTSVLNPGGMVEIAGERFEARSALSLIPVGTIVRVVSATGNVLIVEQEHIGQADNPRQQD